LAVAIVAVIAALVAIRFIVFCLDDIASPRR
jgi:hypothetical protein